MSTQEKKPDYYMSRVEPNERVERGSKEIRADGQTVLIDQLLPFKGCSSQEGRAKGNRRSEPQSETRHPFLFDCFLRTPDRQTARKQADRTKNREFQYLPQEWVP